MAQTIFYIIIGIILLDFVLEQTLDFLNFKHFAKKIPNELQGIYDDEKYEKSQQYKKSNAKFGFISSIFSLAMILIMLAFDGFAIVDEWARQMSENPILIAIIFFGILFFASDLLTTPFAIYSTFVIEEKFGFNKTTVKTFIVDKIKTWALATLIGGGLLTLIVWIYTLTQENFWIYTWAVISAFSIFTAMFYSTLLAPIFNKQTPLAEGELRDAIKKMSSKAGFEIDNVFVINGSKRSTKANAYFSGLGHKKRIVLYDTLINKLTNEQLTAVLAHEIGHYKEKHVTKGIFINIINTGVILYILSLFIANTSLSQALGASQHSFHLAIISFSLLYTPISTVLGILTNAYSRKNEYQADLFAKKMNLENELISGLKKLSTENLSNLTPHPAYVYVHYSHPTLLERIKSLQKKIITKNEIA